MSSEHQYSLIAKGLTAASAVLFAALISIAAIAPVEDDNEHPEWGFYGHRLINKLAVFCLPQDVLPFFKKNIEYLTEHAVDPDKRRYATRHEAARHYIDIDAWGTFPFKEVPRDFNSALVKYSHYKLVNGQDTSALIASTTDSLFLLMDADSLTVYTTPMDSFRLFFRNYIRPQYYEDEWTVTTGAVDSNLQLQGMLLVEDHFSQEGILPYHLSSMKAWLTKAFTEGDVDRILRLSAEFGHYIGDAHVPLHTTRNYNGQLTDQVGIHAFWESRIPELFAEAEYNFIVGRAEYIENTNKYFWDVVLDSHKLLDDVLDIEKELSKTFPNDKQYCYDERLDRTIRVQCPEYAKAYQDRMNGMVEARMQDAILSIASVWYTCWVDGGQPDLGRETVKLEPEVIERDNNVKPRSHE